MPNSIPTSFTVGLIRPSMPHGVRYKASSFHGSSYRVRVIAPPTEQEAERLRKRIAEG